MKVKQSKRKKGFTLIELLIVVAIIGILASIAIPTTGLVMNKVKMTKSQAQFMGYINAIKLYKEEYGYWPPFNGGNNKELNLGSSSSATKEFYRFMTGRDLNGDRLSKSNLQKYNPKAREFYTFSTDDFDDNGTPTFNDDRIIDAFGNKDIIIVLDTDMNGFIDIPTEENPTRKTKVRAQVGIYTKEDLEEGLPFISAH